MSTRRDEFAGGSSVLPTLSGGLEMEISDFEAANVMLQGDCLRQVFENVIGGVPTILEVWFMYLSMSLGRILLHGSVLRNLFNPMRHQVDRRKVEVSS